MGKTTTSIKLKSSSGLAKVRTNAKHNLLQKSKRSANAIKKVKSADEAAPTIINQVAGVDRKDLLKKKKRLSSKKRRFALLLKTTP